MKTKLVPLVISLGVLAVGVGEARAQITERIEADVPFTFHAGKATLPAGKYLIEESSAMDRLLQISTPDGRTSAFVTVESAESDVTPDHTELIFNKYGDQYFLSKVFEEGNTLGGEVPPTRYEKALSQGMAPVEHHVHARHRAQAK